MEVGPPLTSIEKRLLGCEAAAYSDLLRSLRAGSA
jgi:hypothetical protein